MQGIPEDPTDTTVSDRAMARDAMKTSASAVTDLITGYVDSIHTHTL